MNSTLTVIALVISVLGALLLRLKLDELSVLKRQVYDLVSFGRNGNPSKDELSNILKKSSYTPLFSDLTLVLVLLQLQYERKITTSTMRVTCGTNITHVTTYALCTNHTKSTVQKDLHLS